MPQRGTLVAVRDRATTYFKALQDEIAGVLNRMDGTPFRQDIWTRPGGGGGDTRTFSGGRLLEKGAVNFSAVSGQYQEEFARKLPLGDGLDFYATGISIILHPLNPFVPSFHANLRYLQRGDTGWFGGGADLTPYYPFEADVVHFHRTLYDALLPFGEHRYREFKAECDRYFYLPHRKVMRGVGGILFDHQTGDPESVFAMVRACGDALLEAYVPIAERCMSLPYGERHKAFQEIRRGRYVEFNLLYDRGTAYGLRTDGRVESILISLPERVRWVYDYQPEPGSPEAELWDYLQPRDWLAVGS
ncbi:MAG: coproporphyrinogen oxidase [Firmicutes bacterium]|nr:coproporphyrinogen oxidase [Bacillota bacterium]